MQHEPDGRPAPKLTLGGRNVRLRLDGVELGADEPRRTAAEAKPKPPQPDDPRPSLWRDVGGPYGAG